MFELNHKQCSFKNITFECLKYEKVVLNIFLVKTYNGGLYWN